MCSIEVRFEEDKTPDVLFERRQSVQPWQMLFVHSPSNSMFENKIDPKTHRRFVCHAVANLESHLWKEAGRNLVAYLKRKLQVLSDL